MSGSPRKVVLLVENAAIVREPIEAAIRSHGADVVAVDTVPAALAVLETRTPDLIVVDLSLPDGDGWSMLTHVRACSRLAELPVIVLSGLADKATVVKAARLKVFAFIIKSRFSFEGFMARVRHALEGVARPEAAACPDGPAPGPLPSPERPAAAAPAGTPTDPASALRNLKPIITRSELTACVDRCEQLKAFSPTVAQLMKITASPDCSLTRLVKVASQDPAIALKILKLANSVAYGRNDPVDSLKHAVMRIGLDKIREAVMSIGLIEQLDGAPATVSLPHFWEHAIGCAVVAAELAHATGALDSEAAFTAGLLHDVGRIVLMEQLGDRYADVVARASELRLPLEQVEARMLLLNHADVMDRLLHAWKFSRQITNPVVFHHLSAGGIRQSCPREVAPVSLLALANRLAHAMLLGSSGNDLVYATEELCQVLRIDGAAIAAVCDAGPVQTADMKVSMLSVSNAGQWKSFKDQTRAALAAPFRPLFVSAEPALDAYRILCATLAGPGGADGLEPPNIGVIHLAHARDIVRCSAAYAAAEETAGSDRLPLIVISPLGQLHIEPGLAGERPVKTLPSPLSVHEFVEAINELAASRGEVDSTPVLRAA